MTEATDNRKFDLCITTRNQFEVLIASFQNVIGDQRISQIILLDDKSDEIFYWKLEDWLQFDAPEERIKLCQNEITLGEYLNKQRAVIFGDTDYIILTDSKTQLTTGYIDKIYAETWNENEIIKITNDEEFIGIILDQENIKEMINKYSDTLLKFLNTTTLFANKIKYLDNFDTESIPAKGHDNLYYVFNFLRNGGKIKLI